MHNCESHATVIFITHVCGLLCHFEISHFAYNVMQKTLFVRFQVRPSCGIFRTRIVPLRKSVGKVVAQNLTMVKILTNFNVLVRLVFSALKSCSIGGLLFPISFPFHSPQRSEVQWTSKVTVICACRGLRDVIG